MAAAKEPIDRFVYFLLTVVSITVIVQSWKIDTLKEEVRYERRARQALERRQTDAWTRQTQAAQGAFLEVSDSAGSCPLAEASAP